jgi:hypothetical protein
MLQQLVQATIEFVFGDHFDIFAQQIPHGATLIPLPVQPPLTAGRKQPVADQGFQDVEPAGILATGRQSGDPEAIEIKQVPQLAGQPTGAPLSWPMELHSVQLDLDPFTGQFRERTVSRKQGYLSCRAVALLDHLDGLHPGGLLPVIDLTKVKHLSLDNLFGRRPMVFNDTPIAMLFSVFEASFGSKKHASQFTGADRQIKGVGRHYTQNQKSDNAISMAWEERST